MCGRVMYFERVLYYFGEGNPPRISFVRKLQVTFMKLRSFVNVYHCHPQEWKLQ